MNRLFVRSRAIQTIAFVIAAIGFPSVSDTRAQMRQPIPSTPLVNCTEPMYRMVPTPDAIGELWKQQHRWRLVIGASEFRESPAMNRAFVSDTAKAIDARLAQLGYAPLPSRSATPYLIGPAATKQAITDALREIATVAKPQDVVVIYFIGHGTVTPSGTDLSLSVFDRPVSDDDGVRVSDLVGRLTVGQYRPDVDEIPHVIIVLETCYSGILNGNAKPLLAIQDGAQRLVQIQTPIIPNQMVVISATAAGDDLSRAYDLKGTGLSAFGYYFARALNEDWACADSTADGILTARELVGYLQDRLKSAYETGALSGPMYPAKLAKDDYAFLAYNPARYATEGDRRRIATISVDVPPGRIASISFGDAQHVCVEASCTYFVSANKNDLLRVAMRDRLIGRGGAAAVPPDAVELPNITTGSQPISDVIRAGKTVVGGAAITAR